MPYRVLLKLDEGLRDLRRERRQAARTAIERKNGPIQVIDVGRL